jgi:hypothetical protein
VGLWIVAIAIALPFAPQATQVLHSGGFVSPDFESEQATTLLAQKLQVHGVVWMDHQWGNFLTPGGGGWDWYSIQLNIDTEMVLCRHLHRLPGNRPRISPDLLTRGAAPNRGLIKEVC